MTETRTAADLPVPWLVANRMGDGALPLKKVKPNAEKTQADEPWKAFQVRHRSMEVKRDAVMKTAAHLFLEHGYQKTSMSLLAARLKVTKPALYYYFRNKEEILVECYRSGIAEIEGSLGRLNPDAVFRYGSTENLCPRVRHGGADA